MAIIYNVSVPMLCYQVSCLLHVTHVIFSTQISCNCPKLKICPLEKKGCRICLSTSFSLPRISSHQSSSSKLHSKLKWMKGQSDMSNKIGQDQFSRHCSDFVDIVQLALDKTC